MRQGLQIFNFSFWYLIYAHTREYCKQKGRLYYMSGSLSSIKIPRDGIKFITYKIFNSSFILNLKRFNLRQRVQRSGR